MTGNAKIGLGVIVALLCADVPAHGEGVDDAHQSEIPKSREILSISALDCQCISEISAKIGDDNIMGRLVLGMLRGDNQYLSALSKEAESSVHYRAGSVLTLEDRQPLVRDRMGRFGVSLRRICDLNVNNFNK
jgi:hypothetical protein